MKKILSISIFCIFLFGSRVDRAAAQQSARPPAGISGTDSGLAQEPHLSVNPLKAIQQFESPIDEAYELGAGDTINIHVVGHPDLSHAYEIGPDGLITIDMVGSVKVTNMTRETAAKTIRATLASYFTDPTVTVGVQKYGSNKVMIFGNVQHPGILAYEGTTPTLLDAVARGGLLVNSAAKDGLPDQCIIYRGNDTVVPVALRQMLMSASPLADIRLRRGDMIFIPIEQQQFISVLGQVQKPGPVAIKADLDLKMAITQAGGISDEAGGNPTIHIVQTASNRDVTITFKDLMKPSGGNEISLHPGDVIYVPKSGFSKVAYVLTKLSPAATMVTLGALVVP